MCSNVLAVLVYTLTQEFYAMDVSSVAILPPPVQVTLPQEMGPRRDHTATVFGSGHNFRLVVMFGGMWSLAGHLIAGTTLLHLGEWQFGT